MNIYDNYYSKIHQEVTTKQLSNEDGGTREQLFTRYATDLLKLKAEVDTVSISYDEKSAKIQMPHKVNAFSFGNDMETLDIFVTKYYSSPKLVGMTNEDMALSVLLATNFIKKSMEQNYATSIAESAEIFECAHLLGFDEEFRENLKLIRIYVLTNGLFYGDEPDSGYILGRKTEYRVVDLRTLYQMSTESLAPIDVDFQKRRAKAPCITLGDEYENDTYQPYLAIVPGWLLADLYKEYGVRLMESNVRQFLQFTGKTNKGIKETIDDHPDMFMAYNNGIAATARSLEVDSKGNIKKIANLQIVNGGQTTASLFHARELNSSKTLDRVFVQMKISVIKKESEYDTIVSNISRCANTQNKVNEPDFTANDDRLVQLEKMSRYLMTPETKNRNYQTYWFFERAKGQYRNFRLKDGFTRQREKQFDLKYPKNQCFSKTDLAKYVCSYDTKYIGDIMVIGPHIVCRGNEKCYNEFFKHLLPVASKIDNIYYEDMIAKAIIFKAADRIYGTKSDQGCIGDLKKMVVPYTIALLQELTKGQLDLYTIWTRQCVSLGMEELLKVMMTKINDFIITHSPSARFEEWGKKEECWKSIKNETWSFPMYKIQADLIDPSKNTIRKSINKTEEEEAETQYKRCYLESIPTEIWEKTALWGEDSGLLNLMQQIICKEIARKLKQGGEISDDDIEKGNIIVEILSKNNINLLYESDAFTKDDLQIPDVKSATFKEVKALLTDARLRAMVEWDKDHHHLKPYQVEQISNHLCGYEELNKKKYYGIFYAYHTLKAHGFKG